MNLLCFVYVKIFVLRIKNKKRKKKIYKGSLTTPKRGGNWNLYNFLFYFIFYNKQSELFWKFWQNLTENWKFDTLSWEFLNFRGIFKTRGSSGKFCEQIVLSVWLFTEPFVFCVVC